MIDVTRIGTAPIIDQDLCDSLGDNINGPALVRRPDWAPGPGKYMLFFSHHKGQHIRLATADDLAGPWQIYRPGVLHLHQTPLAQTQPDAPQPAWAVELGVDGLYPHLASPDVHVNDTQQRFDMWFHGMGQRGVQLTYYAASTNGLDWQVSGPPTDETYLRIFRLGGETYALARLGVLMKLQPDGVFAHGHRPIDRTIRHVAVLPRADRLHVLYSCLGDAPERLFHTELDLSGDWRKWSQCAPEIEILRPDLSWEGADLPIEPGLTGAVSFTNALRDPEIFVEDGRIWVVYSGGGEWALGLAEMHGI